MKNFLTNKYCDEALQRLSTGDMDALSVIYERLGRRIYLLALSILRDSEAAKDVMQETFLKLATGARAYKEQSNATAYILTVARNLSLDLLAKRRQIASHERELDSVLECGANDPFFEGGTMLGLLYSLGEDERQIIMMKLEGKMKHRDIAALLGISEEACQKRYRRALEKLKQNYMREVKK